MTAWCIRTRSASPISSGASRARLPSRFSLLLCPVLAALCHCVSLRRTVTLASLRCTVPLTIFVVHCPTHFPCEPHLQLRNDQERLQTQLAEAQQRSTDITAKLEQERKGKEDTVRRHT